MRVAVYQYENTPGGCPSCNQASKKMISMGKEACRDKGREVFGDQCIFSYYLDRCESRLTGPHLKEVKNRPNLLLLLEHIEEGKIDAVIMTYMGDLSIEQEFILEFYRFLKEHGVKLATVKDGIAIMDMMDAALALSC